MNFREQCGLRPKVYVRCERCKTTPVTTQRICRPCNKREKMATKYPGRKR